MGTATPRTIAHISDLHVGAAMPGRLEAAREALNALAPACIVATGDITQSGRKAEFAAAAAWFATLESPVVACPGNHDAPVFALHRRFTSPFARFAALGLAGAWADPEGRVAVATLNSARAAQWRLNWSHGAYRLGDLTAALAAAAAAAPQGWRIVACHHPPRTPKGSPLPAPTAAGLAGLQVVSAAPRTIMLCGHVHAPTQEQVGEAQIITAPSLASPRHRGQGQGFNVLRFTEGLQVEAWRWTGRSFEPSVRDRVAV